MNKIEKYSKLAVIEDFKSRLMISENELNTLKNNVGILVETMELMRYGYLVNNAKSDWQIRIMYEDKCIEALSKFKEANRG